MGCEHVGGYHGTAWMCSHGEPAEDGPRCACGAHADRLCDFAIDGGTCDAPICDAHATRIAPQVDRCQQHAPPPSQDAPCSYCGHGRLAHIGAVNTFCQHCAVAADPDLPRCPAWRPRASSVLALVP